MPRYTTVPDLKLRIGETSATYDRLLGDLLDSVEAQIRLYLGFDPTQQAVTWYFSTEGEKYLSFPAPFSAVANVWEDTQGNYSSTAGSFDATAALLTLGTDYAIRREGNGPITGLVRLQRNWPVSWHRMVNRLASSLGPTRGCVKVSATAGESPVSAICPQAALAEAAAQWAMRLNGVGMQQSESVDGLSVSLSAMPPGGQSRPRFLSPLAETLLRPYRRAVIGGAP